MNYALLTFLVVLNFAISWFNAWSTGKSWAESKAFGGFPRLLAWCGAIMSASGFTWCYLVIVSLVAQKWIPAKYAEAIFRIGYLTIIIPVIGTGIVITVQSWMTFWRNRTLLNGGVAAWNTFADVYNIYTACRAIPESLSFLKDLAKGSDDDDSGVNAKLIKWAIILAILCIVGGALTTTAIIRSTARTHAVSIAQEMRRKKNEEAAAQ